MEIELAPDGASRVRRARRDDDGGPPAERSTGPTGGIDLEALYGEHRLLLTRLATSVVLDRDLADDIVHDAFVNLGRRSATGRVPIANPGGYLRRSVVNTAINAVRRRRTAQRWAPPPPPVAEIPELDETWAAVCRLHPRQRAVVVLRYWLDLSEADIAATLGWRRGTVKSNLHRALARLREEITP